jgi:MFS family permease
MLGNHFSLIALPTLAIVQLDFGATEVGFLGMLRYLPFAVLGLPAGVLADRIPRRLVMIVCDVGSMLTLLSLVASSALGTLGPAQLYAVALAAGLFHVCSDVAFNSYLPRLVGSHRLLEANAKMAVSGGATSLAGPPVAGIAIASLGAARVLAVDALSFLAAAVALIGIRTSEPRSADGPPMRCGALLRESVAALRGIAANRVLRSVLACGVTKNVGHAAFDAIAILFMYRRLGFSPAEIGIVYAIASAGDVAGALGLVRVSRKVGLGVALVASVTIMGLALVATPLSLNGSPLVVLGGLLFLAGVSTTIYDTAEVAIVQASSADSLRGRVVAALRTLTWGSKSLGFLLGGLVASQFGLTVGLMVGGSLVALAAGWLALGGLGRLTEDSLHGVGPGEVGSPRRRARGFLARGFGDGARDA